DWSGSVLPVRFVVDTYLKRGTDGYQQAGILRRRDLLSRVPQGTTPTTRLSLLWLPDQQWPAAHARGRGGDLHLRALSVRRAARGRKHGDRTARASQGRDAGRRAPDAQGADRGVSEGHR